MKPIKLGKLPAHTDIAWYKSKKFTVTISIVFLIAVGHFGSKHTYKPEVVEVNPIGEAALSKCYYRYTMSAKYDYKHPRSTVLEFDTYFSVELHGKMLNGFGVWAPTSASCFFDKKQQIITNFEIM